MALDVFEQQRRAFGLTDQIGDGGGFEIGVHFGGDALELAHLLDLGQPRVEIALVGGARRLGNDFRLLAIAAIAANRYAHFHGSSPHSMLPALAAE